MYSLLLLSLAVLAPVLAAPGAQYSYPTSTSTPTATAANVVSHPTPFTIPSPTTIKELKRRGAVVPAVLLDKRQLTCSSDTYTCSDNSGCCKIGTLCFGYGYCYDPSINMDAQISSILAEYTGVDYLGVQSMLDLMTNTYALAGSSTGGSYQTGTSTNTNTNSNTNDINIGGGSSDSAALGGGGRKKKSNTGMIAGIIVTVVVLVIGITIAFWLSRRNKKNKEEMAVAAQQPLMTQPQPSIDTPQPPPGPYPPTPGPYGFPAPVPYPPTTSPFDTYSAAADKNKVLYYNNQPVPPNTVEMPANQSTLGHSGQQHYQAPALPAAGIVEANGESVYRPPSGAGQNPNSNYGQQQPSNPQISEMSGQGMNPGGQPLPNQPGPVYEMDSRQYGQN